MPTLYKEGDYVPSHRGYYHICPVCQQGFYGRKNKKFCSRPCKIKLNNDTAVSRQEIYSDHINTVKKCRNILKEFHPKSLGQHGIPVKYFQQRGFDFSCPCKRIKREDGVSFNLIIDYAYRVTSDKEIVIIRKPNNII